jgi:hypothetical protein
MLCWDAEQHAAVRRWKAAWHIFKSFLDLAARLLLRQLVYREAYL